MAGESNELRDKLKNLEDQVAALNGRTDNLGKDIEDLKNNKADKGDVNGLKDRVKALEEEVKRLKKGETATAALDNIVFETGSSKLTGNSENILTNLVNMLKIHNVSSLEISGHTDNVGGEAYNQRLSEKRAESVKAYLVNAGFDGSKITTSGYGFKKPIADNSTPQGRKKNRRVEISVIK
ncbi:MAG: OmpA family protein [Prevotellaceae bacterium]|nr:OmpA family protein [Prevotellaceae bacterium]